MFFVFIGLSHIFLNGFDNAKSKSKSVRDFNTGMKFGVLGTNRTVRNREVSIL